MAISYNSETQYTRRIDNFRGIDMTSPDTEVEPYRFAYAKNVYRDYGSGAGTSIETVPGYRAILAPPASDAEIYGIWSAELGGVRHVLVHRGTELLIFKHDDRDGLTPEGLTVIPGLAAHRSNGFVFMGSFYILDGTHYLKLVNNELRDVSAAAYLPVTYVNGEMYEQRNMLSDKCVNRDTHPQEATWNAFYKLDTAGKIKGFRDGYSANVAFLPDNVSGTVEFSGNTDIKKAMVLTPSCNFIGCTELEEVYESHSGAILGGRYAGCSALRKIMLGGSAFVLAPLNDSPVEIVYLGTHGELTHVNSGSDRITLFQGSIGKDMTVYTAKSPSEISTAWGSSWANDIATDYRAKYIKLNGEIVATNDNLYMWRASSKKPPDGYIFPDIGGDAGGDEETVGEGIPVNFDDNEYKIEIGDPAEYYPLSFEDSGKVLYLGSSGTYAHLMADGYPVFNSPDYSVADGIYIRVAEHGGAYYEVEEIGNAGGSPESTINVISNTPTPAIFDIDPVSEATDKTDYTIREIVCYDPAESVESVMIGDKPADFWGVIWHTIDGKRYVDRVLMTNNPNFEGKDTDVTLNCYPSEFQKPNESNTLTEYQSFGAGNANYTGTSKDAICKCTQAATFDGRVFFSGNPELPNTIFWCSRDLNAVADPAYFGQLNYTNDGFGENPIVALMSTASMLMALKRDNPDEPTVYYHSGVDTGNDVIPRIYPAEAGVAGIGCVGAAMNFLDDAVFLSPRGLEAVGKQQVNLERTLTHRSSYVDGVLKHEKLSGAVFAMWQGYLAIFTPSGNVYLADSRQLSQDDTGDIGYEWWRLEGVGHYRGQVQDFVQSTGDFQMYLGSDATWFSESGAFARYSGDRIPVRMGSEEHYYSPSEVYATELYASETGAEVYYSDAEHTAAIRAFIVIENGEAVLVEPSERYSGGSFSPVSAAANIGGSLYFGTTDGAVLVFNDDKRSEPFGGDYPGDNVLHSHFYSFDGRTIHSAAVTCYDTAGYPGVAKKTTKKSFVLYAKNFENSRITVRVRTNRSDEWKTVGDVSAAAYRPGVTDFSNSALQLSEEYIGTIKEKEKKWAVKQLLFESGERHLCPIGFYHFSYRFTLKGRIKA